MDIWRRFCAAWEITTQERSAKKEALEECGIPWNNFAGAIRSPEKRKLKIEWVAALCVNRGISVEYVMTGRGKMLT